uniref:Reverse transcriptase Ty1/copia-type domain-containing protein n=1 Tax=Vitis vinifera TaxID=29760 RepID=A5AWH8_VITVI|nr:hypothetical protein VITISV_027842 [Vitis vinifera]
MDNDIYIKIPKGFKLPEANSTKPRSMYLIKLQRSLYGYKQSGCMWYNHLSEYLLKEGYMNNPICPCIFIKKSETEFAIITVYVDDLNLVGTPKELTRTTNYFKNEFEMKDLGKTKFCLGLQIKHFPNKVLVHQSTYIKKVLKHFYMDKAHHLSSSMRYFRLSAIGALIYLANCIRPNILFSVNLLARYSSAPTRRHLNSIKHILHYLRGTTDMSLFYSRESKQQLLGYADAEYLSYSYKSKSQTWYVFNYNGTTISWRSIKQIMVVTSSNHSEILAIHEASCECIWLRSMIQHIQESCGLPSIRGNATKLHEDNVACIAQIKLRKKCEIDVQQIRSYNNLADLFTKALPLTTLKKLRNHDQHYRLRRWRGENGLDGSPFYCLHAAAVVEEEEEVVSVTPKSSNLTSIHALWRRRLNIFLSFSG